MLNLKYIENKKIYGINFKRISDHVVEISGDFPVKEVGFTLSRIGDDDNWDYSDYTTIYRKSESGVQFSNDGSIYIEPETTPIPDIELYEPSEEELKELERIKTEQEAAPTNIELSEAVMELAEIVNDIEIAIVEIAEMMEV